MPRLARLRFVNVGHARSRMRDLTLDLRDAEGHPTDSTLWLRNGGGKSSILNLFFALVRPGRHEFLGGKADARQRRIEDYVLPEDRAVIVAEWELDPEGTLLSSGPLTRFLTGVFYEYRSGAASPEESRLKRLFFCAQVSPDEPALTLEGLPLFLPGEGGATRRATLPGFRQRWRELAESRGYLGVQQTEIVQEWRSTLERVGIDPELFRYQIRMNAREGGADEVFRFGDGEQFVDFLVELVMDASLGDLVGKNVTIWRDELKDRVEKLLPEKEMTVGLEQRLGPLMALAEDRRALALACAREQGRLAALEAWLGAEAASERSQIETAEEAADVAHAEADSARRDADEAARRGAGLRRFAARLQREAAERERKKLDDAYKIAGRERAIWQAAGPLKEALGHEAEARRRREELAHKTADAEPLRVELVAVAGRYAGATMRLVTAAQQQETEAVERRSEAEERRKTAEDAAKNAFGRKTAAEADATGAGLELERIEQCRAGLEREGLLAPKEPASVAVRRLEAVRDSALKEIDRQEGAFDTCQRDRANLDEPLERAKTRMADAMTAQKDHEARLEKAGRARRTFEESARLQQVLELESLDLDRVPDASLQQISVAARRHADDAVNLRAARAEDERAIAGLDGRGLLPPTREVELVLGALKGLNVWSGWSWLEANEKAERRADVVRRAPSHVLGVIVRDVDFEEARARLMAEPLLLDFPVTVVSAASFGQAEPSDDFVVGPATAALFDKLVAARERALRHDRIEHSEREEDIHRRERTALDELHAELVHFRLDHPQGWFADQLERIRWSTEGVADAKRSLTALKTQATELEQQRDCSAQRREDARKAERLASDQLAQVRAFANEHDDRSPRLKARLDTARAEAIAAREAEEVATADAERAGSEIDAAQEDATRWYAEARARQEVRKRIIHVEIETDPGVLDADTLAGRYDDLRAQYDGRLNQEQLRVLAEESDRHAESARVRLAKCLGTVVKEADVMEMLGVLSDGEDVDQRYTTSVEAWSAAQGRLGQAGHLINQAAGAFAKAEAECTEIGFVPEPEPPPVSMEASLEGARRADLEREHARHVAEDQHLEAQVHEKEKTRADSRLRSLEKDSARLGSLRETYAELFTGEPSQGLAPGSDDEASDALNVADRALREARVEWLALDAKRTGAVQKVREWIDEPRFEALRHAMARQFGRLADIELETRAEELQAQLALRAQTLDGQVAGVNRHRELLLSELAMVADAGLAILKSAESWSRLPESIPGFAGHSFLRIHHSAPEDPSERKARLGELLDQMVREEKDIPGGTLLIQRVIRKIIHPVRVKVLFPDPTSREPPMDIAEVAKFSGGEQLTCAILLYCTLAQMRARRSGRRRRSSVLVLDNPIGRASRTRFLELQRDVARAMDIQLIYTTGINDHEALHALPNRIRLRNDRADRTRGHQVIEHDHGEIVAVRFQRREVTPSDDEQDGS